MRLKRTWFLFCICLSPILSWAQSEYKDTIIHLSEVVVIKDRLDEYAIGVKVQQLDTNQLEYYRSQTLAETLFEQSGVVVKSYGLGGLASPSIRGGGSSHVPILWNGLNLQSPMNGGVNLALFPTAFFDDVKVQYGGSGTLFGSGTMTGAIHLNSSDLFSQPNSLRLTGTLGSFNNQLANVEFKTGNARINSSTKLLMQNAENDFPFTNSAKFGQPEERQTNAGFSQFGIMQSNGFRTGANSQITSALWFSHFDKDLQTLMTDSDTSAANQVDKSIRATVNWQRAGEKIKWDVRAAYFWDDLFYSNTKIPSTNSGSTTRTFITEAQARLDVNSFSEANIATNYTRENAVSDGLNFDPERNRISLFGNYRLNNIGQRLNGVFNLRQEIVDGDLIPLVYSLGLDYKAWPGGLIKGNFSKNYRIPTFNDLYWQTTTGASGNPNLRPEDGYSGEIGMEEFLSTGPWEISLEQNIYGSVINDWIVWLPDENGIWTPTNKKTGESYGAELGYKLKRDLGKCTLASKGFYQYTHSKNTSESSEGFEIESKSWYIPKHRFNLSAELFFKNLFLGYTHNFTGKRNYDELHQLEAYHLGTFSTGYAFKINSNSLDVQFKVNNLWNADYQVVAWYAMPPRNYLLTLTYQLNFKQ